LHETRQHSRAIRSCFPRREISHELHCFDADRVARYGTQRVKTGAGCFAKEDNGADVFALFVLLAVDQLVD
jgi:hypothetical protein